MQVFLKRNLILKCVQNLHRGSPVTVIINKQHIGFPVLMLYVFELLVGEFIPIISAKSYRYFHLFLSTESILVPRKWLSLAQKRVKLPKQSW